MAACSIATLGSCIVEYFFEYLLVLVNAPINFLVSFIQQLLAEPVNLTLFTSLWSIVISILSMFYGLLLLYIGMKFLVSGHSPVSRENAKSWLKNTIIMVVLVQASYFIYEILQQIASGLTTGIFNMIDPSFFTLSASSFASLGLELFMYSQYLIVLFLVSIILVFRYLLVAVGVAFFPIGIFLYFIPSLENYGKSMLSLFTSAIFLPFFYAIVLLVGSLVANLPLFSSTKIMILIPTFASILFVTLWIIAVAVMSAIKGTGIFGLSFLLKKLL